MRRLHPADPERLGRQTARSALAWLRATGFMWAPASIGLFSLAVALEHSGGHPAAPLALACGAFGIAICVAKRLSGHLRGRVRPRLRHGVDLMSGLTAGSLAGLVVFVADAENVPLGALVVPATIFAAAVFTTDFVRRRHARHRDELNVGT